jgi:hypothetical protein
MTQGPLLVRQRRCGNQWQAFTHAHNNVEGLLSVLLKAILQRPVWVGNANSILELILDSHRLLSFYQPTVIEKIKLELLNFKDLTRAVTTPASIRD